MKMDKLVKQAQRMQAQMQLAQEELEKAVVEGTSGGGAVKATVNGHGNILSITIDKEVVNPDEVEMLEDLVLSAVKEAIVKSQELSSSKMNALTGGLGGFSGFPGF
ncbi:MAG: YbaB/EbfC family nucleoid-associated protein [Synergistes sp.]|nr:YbaB/EbfC family nucleoid-associated protein [Synergistes sp.]